jgi:hypothetical protein
MGFGRRCCRVRAVLNFQTLVETMEELPRPQAVRRSSTQEVGRPSHGARRASIQAPGYMAKENRLPSEGQQAEVALSAHGLGRHREGKLPCYRPLALRSL